MAVRTLGAQVAFALADRDVSHVFGVPGVHNLELYRGIHDAGLTHILARHEQGAGFMADGYARASGKPGIAFVISGPGLCNIMTPLGQAYSDSVPMLAVSSSLPVHQTAQTKLHQMRDQVGAGRTVADWSEEATTPDECYALIDRAFEEFTSERNRPKHIQIPLDLLAQMVEAPPKYTPSSADRPHYDLTGIANALVQARRPLFVVGAGAKRSAVAKLQTQIQAAVFETYAGKGIVPFVEPLNYGAFLARPGSADEIKKADVVVVLGTELSEVDLWRDDLGTTGNVFVVDTDPDAHPLNGNAEMIPAPCEVVVDHLLERVASKDSDWSRREIAEARARFRLEVDQERPGIVPVTEALGTRLPEDLWLVSDMTQFAYAAKEVFPQKKAGHWLHPYGFGTLGYALPAAIGAKVALGNAPVLAIAGDYGFQYTLQELGTAAELELGLPILLWDNSELKEITASMAAVQMPPIETTAQNPDFSKLAEAYGCHFSHPKTSDDLLDEILAGFEKNDPTLIRVTPEMVL
ncbi:MAG: thiamine pyrophosphate-binding protein [Pseudomonadota bacterium]